MTHISQFTLDPTQQREFSPPTLQQPSNLQALIKSGKIVIGTTLSFPSRHVAKVIAATNADWCWIDAEHVAWSPAVLVECIQVIIHESAARMIPVVRVPSKTSFVYMASCLDAGAGGIIIPHIETAEELKAAVAACRFPPSGHRSFPPFTFIPGLTDKTPPGETIFSIANKHVAIIPQVESRLGFENLESILDVCERENSALMIGFGDLRLDMNLPLAMSGDEPQFVQVIEKATMSAKKRGVPLVGIVRKEMLQQRIDEGFRLIVCCSDFLTLAMGIVGAVSETREIVEEYMQSRATEIECIDVGL
ncbi:2,4-dihydroxyhept-2-ene-1,7-dioic acid aldolase [Favolaschia claudopus]|uniref:2,4-dihydroxyhept-2-ene-1,7-dioic acid aldolase n=1 Tax=Favolaschia claudopus TaxID=2862362 RepID=A0AAW0D351_9AGAR